MIATILGLIAVLWLHQSRTTLASDDGVDLLDPAELEDADGFAGGSYIVWTDYKCQYLSTCSAGFLRNKDKSYAGCSFVLLGCTGSCKQCTGSTNPGYMCAYDPDEHVQCTWSNLVGITPCGTITEFNDCTYFSTPPTGEPYRTPNDCYCAGLAFATARPCMIANCL